MPRLSGLRAKILLLQLGIVVAVVALTCAAFVGLLDRLVTEQYGQRVLSVARSVAEIPEVRAAFDAPDPPAVIQPIAESIRQATGLAFVVVANRDQIRYSHPNPERIGQPLSTDAQLALDGQSYVTTERGTLGLSIRAKVPVLDADGEVIGAVSAGILEDTVRDVLGANWALVGASGALSLVLGALASYLLAGHIKRQIFGLEPPEIAGLLEQREALLHGIREGVVAVDQRGRLTVVNDEAARLLEVAGEAVGQAAAEVLPQLRLDDVLASRAPVADQVLLANGRVLVVSRIPVESRGHLVGAIATFRDHTQLQALARELDGTRSHLDALRAQAHEFANQLHTIAGLVELGWHAEATAFIHRTTEQQQALVETLPRRIEEPALVALLVGKASVAAERGVELAIDPASRLRPAPELADGLLTIVGNLVENAFDAVAGREVRQVQVSVAEDGGWVRVRVRDSGPGVPEVHLERIFADGFSTKRDSPGQSDSLGQRGPLGQSGPLGRRGVGLALVRRAARRLGGDVTVHNDGGAVFEARLARPAPVAHAPAEVAPVALPLAS